MHVKARGFASPGQAAALVIGIAHTHRAALEYLALLRENGADAAAEGGAVAAGWEGAGKAGGAVPGGEGAGKAGGAVPGGEGEGKVGGGAGISTRAGRRMAAASARRRLMVLEREAGSLFGGLGTISATTDIYVR